MEASAMINSFSNFKIPSPKPTAHNHKSLSLQPPVCISKAPFSSSLLHKTYSTKKDEFAAAGYTDEDTDTAERPTLTDNTAANWEAHFLGQIKPPQHKNKKLPNSRLLQENAPMDWCVRARKVALKSIEARGLSANMERMVSGDKKKKKKKKKKRKMPKTDQDNILSNDDDDDDDEEDDVVDLDLDSLDNNNNTSLLRKTVSKLADGMFEERRERTMETFVERLSQFSGPTDRRKEIYLNKSIVEAQSAEEVLEVTADMMMAVAKGLTPSPLSPLNIATALHRIAKSMEKMSLVRTRRLAFARKREMCMLVGMAMAALPQCSAQGLSNIAWALSKIGGDLLYLSEMDRVAEVAITKVDEFNSQNVANLAGAFASMQHSAPELFAELAKRAASVIHTFRPQEIAQVLWAFASLNEAAEPLLDSLDHALVSCSVIAANVYQDDDDDDDETETETTSDEGEAANRPLAFSRDQLGNIAWSYAVMGRLDRMFFSHVWRSLIGFDEGSIGDQQREDIVFASQLHLVKQCLKVEYPQLEQALPCEVERRIEGAGRTRKFNQKVTSSFQKEVLRLLVSTGLEWIKEYSVDGYTVDAVCVDRKVALEIDGPTHFSRNSGVALGHTMLKRRYIAAAGWRVVSVCHNDWEELEGEFQQLDYLRRILDFAYEGSNVELF